MKTIQKESENRHHGEMVYRTPLSPDEIMLRLRKVQGGNVLSTELRFIGTIRADRFSVTATSNLWVQGNFSPRYIGLLERVNDSTVIRISKSRNQLWLIPGYIALAFGGIALLVLIGFIIGGNASEVAPVIWVLALGGMPFGLSWFSWGRWLNESVGADDVLIALEELLELDPDTTTALPS